MSSAGDFTRAAVRPSSAGAAKLARAASAFMRRGFATYLSYRAKLSLGLASLVLSVVTFSFVGKAVASAGPGFAERYGTDYASFVVLGVAAHSIASAGLGCFRSALRKEQLQGTLEVMLTSSLPETTLVFLSGLGEMAVTAVGGAAALLLAARAFGIGLDVAPSAIPAVALYGLFMSGLGLASAGAILITKEGEPVSWVFGAVSGLVGGVYFPVDLLPPWLSAVSRVLPTTHALSLVRQAPPCETGLEIGHSLALLTLSASSSLLLGLLALRWCLRRARATGTLGHY